MTIATSTARASALTSSGETNNPFVTGAGLTGTYSTTTGTQVLAASNAVTGYTYDPWTVTPDTGAAEWQVVYASNQTPTFAGVAAHNLGDVDAVIALQYSTDSGSSWTDSGAGSVAAADNQAIGFRFTGITADYWRFRITSASGLVSVGVFWIGSEIILPQRLYAGYTPPITPQNVDLRTNVSEGGHYLGASSAGRGSNLSAQIEHLTPAFVRGASWSAWQRRWNAGGGSFWAWRPTANGDLHYCWRSQGNATVAPTNMGIKDYMSLTIEGRAYDE